MGRRKNRKQERKAAQRGWSPQEPRGLATYEDRSDDFLSLGPQYEDFHMQVIAQNQKVCGGCREFIEDEHGGRGTCLHPGSGILSPWTDTKSCDFYAKRGR